MNIAIFACALVLLFAPAQTKTEEDKPIYKIGLCIVATGKYISFIPKLLESAEKYFLPDHEKTYFIFTDGTPPPHNRIVTLAHKRLGWPYDTMMRFEVYANHRELLSTMDYLFALDADMIFVNVVGDEILSARVGTTHPGYFNKERKQFTYESRNKNSTAYIDPSEGTIYFAGAFWGGKPEEFFKLCDTCVANITTDLENKFIALWHDESHLNRYFIDNPPTLILSPSYCSPAYGKLPQFEPRLRIVDKNYTEMRK